MRDWALLTNPTLFQVYAALTILMSRRGQDYRAVFTEISRLFPNLNPRSIMTDYEVALRNVARKFWPRAKQLTCWAHHARVSPRPYSSIGVNDTSSYTKFKLCFLRKQPGQLPEKYTNSTREWIRWLFYPEKKLRKCFPRWGYYGNVSWWGGVAQCKKFVHCVVFFIFLEWNFPTEGWKLYCSFGSYFANL